MEIEKKFNGMEIACQADDVGKNTYMLVDEKGF